MRTYHHGRRIDPIDRDGVSIGLDSYPSGSRSPRLSHAAVDLRGQSPLSTFSTRRAPIGLNDEPVLTSSRLTRTGDYLMGPGVMLDVRHRTREVRGFGSAEDFRVLGDDDAHAYAAAEEIRPLRRARALREAYVSRKKDKPPRNAEDHMGKDSRANTAQRKDSVASKLLRRTLNITKTSSVRVKNEPASRFVKSSGSNVFVEQGEFDDGELYAGVDRDNYEYSTGVWSRGKNRMMMGLKREVDQAVVWLVEKGKRVGKKVGKREEREEDEERLLN